MTTPIGINSKEAVRLLEEKVARAQLGHSEHITKLEEDVRELQMIRKLQHETLEVQLESIKLLAQRLIKLEEQARERGWILRDEPHRTM